MVTSRHSPCSRRGSPNEGRAEAGTQCRRHAAYLWGTIVRPGEHAHATSLCFVVQRAQRDSTQHTVCEVQLEASSTERSSRIPAFSKHAAPVAVIQLLRVWAVASTIAATLKKPHRSFAGAAMLTTSSICRMKRPCSSCLCMACSAVQACAPHGDQAPWGPQPKQL
jgi:hypothetical protein